MHLRKALLTAVCVIALGAGPAVHRAEAQAAKNNSVTLKRTFKSGVTERFINTTITEMSGGFPGFRPQRMTQTADMTMTYETIEGETANVISVSSNMKIEGFGDAFPPEQLPDETRSTGKINGQNMMVTLSHQATTRADRSAGLPGAVTQGNANDAPAGVGLPLKPVSPGEKWKTVMTPDEPVGQSVEVENTYVGETVFEGKAAYRITFEGHFKSGKTGLNQDRPEAETGVSRTVTMDITGEAYLDKTDCSILSVTTNTTGSILLSDQGQSSSIKLKGQESQKRVK